MESEATSIHDCMDARGTITWKEKVEQRQEQLSRAESGTETENDAGSQSRVSYCFD